MSQPRLIGDFAPATYDQWRALLKVDDFDRKLVTRTLDGIQLQPLYTAADVPEQGFPELVGAPGGSWEIRQNAPIPSADADPIGTLARHGAIAHGLEQAQQALVAVAKSTESGKSTARPVIVSSSIYHDAGASPALETGIALSTYVTYLRWLADAGMPVHEAAAAIELSVSVGTDFFGEMAKLRALRLCVGKVLSHCGGDPASIAIHARMSRRSLTQRDPWVNMLRATTETFAAAAGGANAITTAPYDILLGDVSELGKRIADNAQVVLDEESHVRAVTDPAAGSYFVENLTHAVARAAWTHFNEIESAGGVLAALQAGTIQKAIAAQADKTATEVKTRKRPITGVSEFALISEPVLTQPKPATSQPTAGGISVTALKPTRLSEPYEVLRDRSDAYLAKHGKRPQVFLCNVGTMAQWKPRAGFTQNFAWAGGIDALGADQGYDDAEAAVAAFVASGAKLAAICSHDELYPELMPKLAKLLRDKGAALIVGAGKPSADIEPKAREAGVGLFIHMGCDVVASLDTMLTKVGC